MSNYPPWNVARPLLRRISLILSLWAVSVSPALAWQYVIQGKSHDFPRSARLDPSGDILVRGYSSDNEAKDRRPILLKVDGATGQEVWQAPVGWAGGMTVDGLGNPILFGGGSRTDKRLTIALHSAFTGFEVWRVFAVGSDTGSARAAVVGPGGDIIVAGHLDPNSAPRDFVVLKVSGFDGAERWRFTLGPPSSAYAVAVDGSGEIVAVGGGFHMVKLSSTGSERWRAKLDGTASDNDLASAAAFDAAGDVIAAGRLTNSGTGSDLTVVKLSGASGAEVWRTEVDAGTKDSAASLLLDEAGNAIAAGQLGGNFGVVKLSGESGAELWRATAEPGTVFSIAVDSEGDVFAAGEVEGTAFGGGGYYYTVAKYSGATGAELWRSRLHGSVYTDRWAEAGSIMVTGSGEVVVAGRLTDFRTRLDLVVRSLRSADGVNPRPSGAKRFILREKTGLPGSRKLFLGSRDAGQIYRNPAANPTDVGASLEITNPTTGESASIALPAKNWKMIQVPNNRLEILRPFKKWLYLDPLQVDGPCKKVVVHSRDLRVVCSGDQIPFTLDESPGQGSLEVRLEFGGDSGTEFCWVFEGDAVKVDKSTTDGPVGRFVAKNAPPPIGCPTP